MKNRVSTSALTACLYARRLLALAILLIVTAAWPGSGGTIGELRRQFMTSPESARPWVYWFWVDGNISAAGITADLEAMQRVGIGGVILLDVAQEIPPGPIPFGGPEWRQMFKHAVAEAARLGLSVAVHNAAGYTGSGGPWVTADQAMRKTVFSRTNLAGPAKFSGPLPRLAEEESSHPIATLAFPTLVGEGARPTGFAPKISSGTMTGLSVSNLLDQDPNTFFQMPAPTPRQSQYLQLEFAKPFTASTLRLIGPSEPQFLKGRLQVSDDGRAFRNVREFASTTSDLSLAFEQLGARYFRIVFTEARQGLSQIRFSEVELSPQYSIAMYRPKSGLGPLPRSAAAPGPVPVVPDESIIKPGSVVDLTTNTSPAGHLDWDVPPGQWTVLRLAHAPMGTLNQPSRPGGKGLECDKMSREAVEAHFAAFLGPLLTDTGEAGRRALTSVHVDSWEVGYQNWTAGFQEAFRKQRGYDMLPYLPALTSRFVGSPEISERFLCDVRRTIAELVADNYGKHLARLARQHGLQLSIQGYASLGGAPFDELAYASRADVPMAEFWLEGNDYSKADLHAMPSVAHTWGKAVVAGEAFTSYPAHSAWREHPFLLKPMADVAFCEGINRLVIHRYAHQPWLHLQPGLTMGHWGVHYERTQTWWEQSTEWHKYLARCQFLLQQGLFVADLCYLTGEDAYAAAPSKSELSPPLPPGYNYDLIAPEVVRDRMSAHDGRLVLPEGMSYAALVLPDDSRMSPALLRRINQLVESGATVIGPRPMKSPGLLDYPHCDQEVMKLASQLWGKCDGRTVTENRCGKGRVLWGRPLPEVLAQSGLKPDFEPIGHSTGSALRWIHRRVENTDLYFVANPGSQPVRVDVRFRIKDAVPEFWHPDTGRIERPAVWRQGRAVPAPLSQDGDSTIVPLQLEPAGSLFVVFPARTEAVDPVHTVTRNGRPDIEAKVTFDAQGKLQVEAVQPGDYQVRTMSGQSYSADVKGLPAPIPVLGQWQVTFPRQSGAPASLTLDTLHSWSTNPDPWVKYFSGTATYTRKVSLPSEFLSAHRKVRLNLGRVKVIAELKVNGQDFGVLWKPPFEADITAAARPGENLLAIKVTSCWPNRLIGDEQLPVDCKWKDPSAPESLLAEFPQWLINSKTSPAGRLSFATWRYWAKDSPLLESGLLGPVTLHVVQQQSVK